MRKVGQVRRQYLRFLEKEYEGLPWGHSSFLSHHLKKLCRNGEVVCVNNEQYILLVDDGDSGNKEEEMSHRLNIANRDGKEGQTLVQGKGREVEAIDDWSGVNDDQAKESEDQCEVERQSVEVNGQNKACEQRIEGFEEQKGVRQELIKEALEESQNFSGQIEVVEEVDKAKGKPAEVSQEQRGEKGKQPEKTEQQIKVLKDDIPRPMMEEEKKYVEKQQQKIPEGSHNRGHIFTRERNSIIVCALPAQQRPQLRTHFYQKAHKLHKGSMSASLESRESGQIHLQQLRLCSRRQPAELKVTTSERLTHSKKKRVKFCIMGELQNSRPKVKTSFGTSKDLQELEENQDNSFEN